MTPATLAPTQPKAQPMTKLQFHKAPDACSSCPTGKRTPGLSTCQDCRSKRIALFQRLRETPRATRPVGPRFP